MKSPGQGHVVLLISGHFLGLLHVSDGSVSWQEERNSSVCWCLMQFLVFCHHILSSQVGTLLIAEEQ